MSGEGKLIRFPVERRREQIARGKTVVGTAVGSVQAGENVQITFGDVSGCTVSSGSPMLPIDKLLPPTEVQPAWWENVPEINAAQGDARMWMKLGASPGLRAKRHRVIAVEPFQDVSPDGLVTTGLIALAACGARKPLGPLYHDAWSGGYCAACRRKGWS